jgi:hypothetical protein
VAQAYSSYYGSQDSPQQADYEIVATACLHRTASEATIRFSWSSIGELFWALFKYQLLDCTDRKFIGEGRMSYPEGAKKILRGSESKTFQLRVRNHQYQVRLEGQGDYDRPGQSLLNSIGHFNVKLAPWLLADGIDPFTSRSTCM